MKFLWFSLKRETLIRVSACAAVLVSTAAHAQNAIDLTAVTDADRSAVLQAKSVSRHAMPVRLNHRPVGQKGELRGSRQSMNDVKMSAVEGLRYPADLQFHHGPVVGRAQSHAIYMLPNGSCSIARCWGNPEQFLSDLGRSNFVHVVDQYVREIEGDRYTDGSPANVSFVPSLVPLTDADIQATIHAVAATTRETGYGNIYHVFLPPGTDQCFDSTDSVCYSPDHPATFYFCAYHGSVAFADIGHVLYTVEPYQNVMGCAVRPGTPNGSLIDSTNNVLSHEVFETITDPDGTAWWNSADNGMYGEEIGDECSFVIETNFQYYFDPSLIRMGSGPTVYAVQPEYDHFNHACSSGTPAL